MKPSLRSNYLRIESDLDQLFEELAALPPDVLEKSPAPGEWSVLEVMQHLIVVEEKSLAYVKKKAQYPESLKKADWKDLLRVSMLKFFLRLPIKVKAPDVVNENNFSSDATFEDLVEKWRNLRQDLLDFLEEIPEEWQTMLFYRHTLAGRLTLDGMMIFFRDHFMRHRRQIERTLEKVQAVDTGS